MTKITAETFFDVITEGNIQYIDDYLAKYDPIELFELKDCKGNMVFHYAAVNGDIVLFYHLILRYVALNKNANLSEQLFGMLNHRQKTPWHYAAQFGHSDFFKSPASIFNENVTFKEEAQTIWLQMHASWLNLPTTNGNTTLHFAIQYDKGDADEKIKRKKQTCAALMELSALTINSQNKAGNTALHIAVIGGCFETAKVILDSAKDKKNKHQFAFDIKNNKEQGELTVNDLAAQLGRQRIDNLYLISRNPKSAKVKERNRIVGLNAVKAYACNVHLHDEEFFQRLKFSDLNEDDIHEIIQLRLETRRKKYRNKSILVAAMASLCPAFFVNVFAEYLPMTLLGVGLTGVIFPIAYIGFVYVCYQSRMREYNAVTAEAIYFSWLSTWLPGYLKNFNQKIKELISETNILIQKINQIDDIQQLANDKQHYLNLQNQYADMLKNSSKIIEFQPNNKKPKLMTTQLSRLELKRKKKLGIFDAKQSSQWISAREAFMVFIGHTADILCPLGAGIELAATISAVITGSIALSLPPFLIPMLAIGGTLLLGGLISYALYKACYKKDQAEIGENNRELVMAYDTFKHSVNLVKTQQLNRHCSQQFKDVQVALDIKEEAFMKQQMVQKNQSFITENIDNTHSAQPSLPSVRRGFVP